MIVLSMHLCYSKNSFNVFKVLLLLSAQLSNAKVSFRHSTHSKQRCSLLSRESSFQQTLSVLLNRLSTQPSFVLFSEESPFNRRSHQSPFYRCSTTWKPLLNKVSLAPLNGKNKTNQSRLRTLRRLTCCSSESLTRIEPCLLLWTQSPLNWTSSDPMKPTPNSSNSLCNTALAHSIKVPMLLSTKHWHI